MCRSLSLSKPKLHFLHHLLFQWHFVLHSYMHSVLSVNNLGIPLSAIEKNSEQNRQTQKNCSQVNRSLLEQIGVRASGDQPSELCFWAVANFLLAVIIQSPMGETCSLNLNSVRKSLKRERWCLFETPPCCGHRQCYKRLHPLDMLSYLSYTCEVYPLVETLWSEVMALKQDPSRELGLKCLALIPPHLSGSDHWPTAC